MEFITERLPLAIYLHATNSLKLTDCKFVRSHKVAFVFADLDEQAATHILEFEQGKQVSATAIFASQKYLRRLMSREFEKEAINKWGF
jgi:hypothetical protein